MCVYIRVTRARVRLNNRALKGVRIYCSTNSSRENEKMPHLSCPLNVNYSRETETRRASSSLGPDDAKELGSARSRISWISSHGNGSSTIAPQLESPSSLRENVVVGRASCKLVVNRVYGNYLCSVYSWLSLFAVQFAFLADFFFFHHSTPRQ